MQIYLLLQGNDMVRLLSLAIAGLLGLGLVLNNYGVSQDKKPDEKEPEKKAKGQLPMGWKKLNLSNDQKTKIYAVQGEYKTKIKALDDQIKALKTQEYADLVRLLTDQQKAELAKGLLPDDPKKKPDDKKPEEKKSDDKN
jgi:hypothetical protein